MKRIGIIGGHNTPFGRLKNKNLYDLFEDATRGAVEDSGIDPKEIDMVFVGNFSGGGFNHQEHIAPYAVNVYPEMRFKPMIRCENACASSSAAMHAALMAIESGRAETVLVLGVEKMTELKTDGITDVLAMASHWGLEGKEGMTFPGLYALYAKGWMKKYGISEDKLREYLAKISSKAYINGAENPLAQVRKPMSAEDILNLPEKRNPMIAEPLRIHDCSLITDGAAALVITSSEDKMKAKDKMVEFASYSQAMDYLDIAGGKRADYFLDAAAESVKKAFAEASMSLNDIQVAEVHDCFSITELLIYSALGLTEPGKEFQAIEDGTVYPDGKLAINPSGGLKSKGHPVGATGASMHYLIYRQLLEDAVGVGVKGAKNGLTLNIGGSGASSFVSILKRTK